MSEAAIVLSSGAYEMLNGKTAHGLVRGSERFRVQAIVDASSAGQDAGEALDGRRRGIPIVATVAEAIEVAAEPPRWCVVGVATAGGRFTSGLKNDLLEALEAGLSIVNGLHQFAADDPDLVAAAARTGAQVIDVRKPRPRHELRFWDGSILKVKTPRIAVLGMDCALGKRTTARMLVQELRNNGLRAEMISTGQTGWMQGAKFGILFDAITNDFLCGELEHALVTCDREAKPDVMVIEGQSGLRNPSGPTGSEFILSGGAKYVVLMHAPGRTFFEGWEELELRIPPVDEEIDLLRAFGARTIAVALHGEGSTPEQLQAAQKKLETRLGIPVIRPLEEGVSELVPLVRQILAEDQT